MIFILHQLVFVLLPLALALVVVLRRSVDARHQATGALRFSTGFAKLVLLALPLWEIGTLVVRGGADNLTSGIALACLVALTMSVAFAWSSLVDLWAGMRGLFGIPGRIAVLEAKHGRVKRIVVFFALALVALVVLCGSLEHALAILKSLFSSPRPTIAIWFQESRVWSNFHLLTLVAALALFFGVPRTEDVLREWRPWKAVLCLVAFAAASAMLWTRFTPPS